MGNHWVEVFILAAIAVILIFILGWYAYQRCFISRQKRSHWPKFLFRRRQANKNWFELTDREEEEPLFED